MEIQNKFNSYDIESFSWTKLVNTYLFSESANTYLKNKKAGKAVYCLAPLGSIENEMFWEEELNRCLNGYKVGDLKITGRMYFYLNYFMILRVPEGTDKNRTNVEKEESFPSFWFIQYLWWNFKTIAHYGGTFAGLTSVGGEDICCVKTRGAGFSYMDAADDIYNFTFIPESKSYIFAYSGEYLDGADGIMPKVQTGLDFIRQATRSYMANGSLSKDSRWGLNRYDTSAEPKEFKSGFKDLNGGIYGTKSQIISVICDKPRKARGKRGRKITLEEFGSFPNSLDILATSQALVKDGAYKVGQIVAFGTGGEEGEGIKGLETVFNNPKSYGMMAFPNIFGQVFNDKVGFFCPSYLANSKYMDKDGNPEMSSAITYEENIRNLKKLVSSREYDKHTAEYPFVPQEALKRYKGNIFPTVEITAQIQRLLTDRNILSNLLYCDLNMIDTGTVEIVPNLNLPVLDYPHKKDQYHEGCVIIKQKPYSTYSDYDKKYITPKDMYYITVDNFGVDDAEDKTSLFCCQVWKKYNARDNSFANLPVAWYRGRPNKQDRAFQILMKLAILYNAQIHGEYNAQGVILINFFKYKKMLKLIADTPDVYKIEDSRRKSKWVKVTTETKQSIINLMPDWLLTPRDYSYEYVNEDDEEEIKETDEQEVLLNVHHIDDIVFLYEMRDFYWQNADTISCAALAMPLIPKDDFKHEITKERGHSEDYTDVFTRYEKNNSYEEYNTINEYQ
jgi:hypothetical protein